MMVRTKLPPGFRFHPTDVELVMYYLKRKVTGRKFNFEAISELNIYKFSPWDLPDKSCLKSKDLEWYFFCPRERKYASGVRMNRATETGFWKATGKDRSVKYNGNIVGMVRTLVFHKGNAPHGTRTDWLIYEYRIENKSLADNGVAQDSYVLCKVFQKNGPGPKNGAQYGAPFQEEDWDDDDCDIPVDSLLDCPFPLQQNQNSSAALGLVGLEPGPSVVRLSLDKVPLDGNSCSMVTNMGAPANISGHSPIEAGVSLQDLSADDMIIDTQNDDIARMLASFVDDPLPLTGNENNEVFHPDQRGEIPMVTNSDDCDPFSGLDDINNLADFNVGGTNFPEMAFLELDDLNPPLEFSAETFGIGELQSNGSYGQSDFGCSQHDLPESSCTQNHSYSDLSPIENRGSVPGYGGCLTDSHQRPRVPDPSNILGNSATAAPVVRCIYRPTSPANILNFSTYKPEGTRNCRETGKR